jgi:hypothetical protein
LWLPGPVSFELNITSLVKAGENCIAVRLDNGCEDPDRWYSGSGLYRNVYLRIVPVVHLFKNPRDAIMTTWKRKKEAADAKTVLFKRLYGVKPTIFEKMLSFLQREYDALYEKGGKPPKLILEDKLCITLKYLREYRRMDSIALEYGVCKGSVCLSIQ